MGAMDNVLLLKMECSPPELFQNLFHFFVELPLAEQTSDGRHGAVEFKRIHESIDQGSTQWMANLAFEEIPPRVKFMLPPDDNFAERGVDMNASFWN